MREGVYKVEIRGRRSVRVECEGRSGQRRSVRQGEDE